MTWTRVGTGSELTRSPQLLVSTNNSSYSVVGTMQKSGSDWVCTGYAPFAGAIHFVRVRGQARGGQLNRSSSRIEMTRQIFDDSIFANGLQ